MDDIIRIEVFCPTCGKTAATMGNRNCAVCGELLPAVERIKLWAAAPEAKLDYRQLQDLEEVLTLAGPNIWLPAAVGQRLVRTLEAWQESIRMRQERINRGHDDLLADYAAGWRNPTEDYELARLEAEMAASQPEQDWESVELTPLFQGLQAEMAWHDDLIGRMRQSSDSGIANYADILWQADRRDRKEQAVC